MLNQINNTQLRLSIILIFIMLGCKNELLGIKEKTKLISKHKSIQLSSIKKETFIRTLNNNEFKLNIETQISNDTLDVVDYKEDIYSSPIILTQKLFFYREDKLLNNYRLPIKYVEKKTINKFTINALQTPLYKVCLIKTNDNDYYIVYGSDYCNGSECPEFTGIYTMEGKTIYEGLSTKKEKPSLKDVLLKCKIKLNNPSQCIKIDDFQ